MIHTIWAVAEWTGITVAALFVLSIAIAWPIFFNTKGDPGSREAQ